MDNPGAAVYFQQLTLLDDLCTHTSGNDSGDAKFAGDDGGMAEDAATVRDDASGDGK